MLDFNKCPCSGSNLDKFIQPLILAILAQEDLYGYKIIQRIAESPMFKGHKPDRTGVYRFLKTMEQRGLVESSWFMIETPPAKKFYHLTNTGLKCLSLWIATLEEYHQSIGMMVEEIREVYAKTKCGKDNLKQIED
ncbi:DNA-binding transcriptional regulator, PadR family [Desulfotomaculum arcticum]|uniref:DNA-binding transcriptional regulator, PadR family n=1 Tax=Desulfotruncus arcticus DSM 17038 TaxID=1121424 RepID=A0A1I2P1G8_9FIRM|nr:PadR family transcriptional regulator [Desulfotruncus arcticus]SFG07546.1 DNA-binding transcriptional regulator, PadR family [Desulfotomaculum arcticum] [Desulfotruncus arcticus DSM 17038]